MFLLAQCTSFLVPWFKYWAPLANGSWVTLFLAPCSLPTVGSFVKKLAYSDSSYTGTFWLVQGTSLMPFFAVGTMYSPSGNTLEGMQTAEYSATVGKAPITNSSSVIDALNIAGQGSTTSVWLFLPLSTSYVLFGRMSVFSLRFSSL